MDFDSTLSSANQFKNLNDCKEQIKGNTKGLEQFISNGNGPISDILDASKNDSNLYSCISAIKTVSKYLSNSDEVVRNLAAEVIASLAAKAAELLGKESNPELVKEMGGYLLGVVKMLKNMNSNNTVNLANSTLDQLIEVEEQVTLKLANVKKPSTDEFVSAFDNPFKKMPKGFTSDQFVSSLSKTMDTITGGITHDQFVSSLDKSMRNIIA